MADRPTAERAGPKVYAIAAHRGFADALAVGLIPRYREAGMGLARLTLLLPSRRAARTMTEAFVRQSEGGLLLPRMAVVGDLDLDEALGPLLDPLGAGSAIPPAADPTRRWLRLAQILAAEMGDEAPRGAALLRLAQDMGRTIDRLLVEDIAPDALLGDPVIDALKDLADHWRRSLRHFARAQALWQAELGARGEIDAAARRNRLFAQAAQAWRADPPAHPIVAAGVTSAAPALARLLRVVSELPRGALVLPDLDLALDPAVWEELGRAGAPGGDDGAPFARGDAITHPQYHLKLLLNRMGVARGEVQPWHRAGIAKAPPERSRAISNLFLPPAASGRWVDLPATERRLAGVRLIEAATPEEEAQAIALLVRQALDAPERRVAVVTPDRGLATRIVHHLRRWGIEADDSAGRPLPQTPPGRVLLLLAEIAAHQAAPVPLIALLQHPLVAAGEGRGAWLAQARRLDLALRGPRPAPGLGAIGTALKPGSPLADWWDTVAAMLAPLLAAPERRVSAWLALLSEVGEQLCGAGLWAREEGRALARFVEELQQHAEDVRYTLDAADLAAVLRDAMDGVAVRPPYGGHPRVAIYGLLESRLTRAELVICAGLNEGSWPAAPGPEPLLAPAVLRALGVPGPDFRIGLAAHDLASALGAPEVVLSRARRGADGPAIPSRFLLRVQALLGDDLLPAHADPQPVAWAQALATPAAPAGRYPRPAPRPAAHQRPRRLSVTALDRLRSDPYDFYAAAILRLPSREGLDAEPGAAEKGTAVHDILHRWHAGGGDLEAIARTAIAQSGVHPVTAALWWPRLLAGLRWVEGALAERGRTPAVWEAKGTMLVSGVELHGRADRIDRTAEGGLAIVDYKTGTAPSAAMVEAGYALQLGTLGLIAQAGGFPVAGTPDAFEYWSLARNDGSETGFGSVQSPVRSGRMRSGIEADAFLPEAKRLLDEALARWITGDEAFTARLNPDAPSYNTYDQLMRLEEWLGRETDGDTA